MAFLAAAIPIITAVSAGVGVATTVAAAQGQAKLQEYNAQLNEKEAKATQDQAAREEEALRRSTNQFFGKQRAAMAEAGIGPGGTTGMLADQNAALAELDALNIRYGGNIRGKGLLSEAASNRASGRAAKSSGYMLAGSQLLSGASDTYKAYKIGAG